jgi:hypothetical protein
MTMIIDGTNGLTFNDATTQTKAGLVVGTASAITSGTVQNTTSGTSIDFTGIPSWVERITVMFQGVSTNGISPIQVQIGSGSFTTTGYLSSASFLASGTSGVSTSTTGFVIAGISAANTRSGHMVLTNITGNAWVSSTIGGFTEATATLMGGGNLTLSGALDRIRITTVGGTNTFDAGSINILYE